MSNFIFDMDGTLLDSYSGILESVMDVLKLNNIDIKSNDALDYILTYSVLDFMNKIGKEYNLDSKKLWDLYQESRINTQYNYKLMPNCIRMLDELSKNGAKLFIFTHKGKSMIEIEKRDFESIFIDVIYAGKEHFKRKPSSYSIDYLVDKYNLDKEDTYYVGDRPIDIECAYNANIKSIFYSNKNVELKYEPTYRIDDLIEIVEIDKQ